MFVMKAKYLYEQLEKDFITSDFSENWYDDEMTVNAEFICDNFKNRSLGLLCDFAEDIGKVYTAVFPSDKVLTKIIDYGVTDAMLFLHHPLVWDLSINPDIAFYQINPELLKKLRDKRISLFNFHLPLDNYSEYSTTKTLADKLEIQIIKPYCDYYGAVCGIIGKTGLTQMHY